ncbi:MULTISPECIES: cupin-like domain-containing protein [Rhodopirellula]|uniref:cupin-like domain-containing protein n=1 Tax=Rhodopirellula TaxID=265488 RepID=UPI00257B0732|nr:cupin-like domain-containing protein [Rhodopirellula sp. UBA1907]MCR9206910.1 cupin-like domain-containing protein [bacterium]
MTTSTPASREIPSLDANDAETFFRDYYATEQPVIFRGVTHADGGAEEVCRALCDKIAVDASVTERLLWYDVRQEMIDDVCTTPPVVTESMNPDTAFLRDNCVRVWFNSGGHTTPWHYDGHSLHVFNLQLKGKKRWTIVAPETPLPNMPFSKTCLFEENSLKGKRVYEFDLCEGDMVFLPRYWFHHVHSVGELNVNVNWVLMPKQQPAATKIAARESEILWLLDKTRFAMPSGVKWMLDNFAGAGEPALKTLTKDVSMGRGISRVAKEVIRSPMVILAIPTLIRKAKTVMKGKKILSGLLQTSQAAQKAA